MATPQDILYPQVTVQLTGQDGNAYMIMTLVRQALADHADEIGDAPATAWSLAAAMCGSYDELLALAMSTVTVV